MKRVNLLFNTTHVRNMIASENATLFQNLKDCSAVPGQSDPYALAIQYREYLVKNYAIYLQKVAESLKIDLSTLVHKAIHLNIHEDFSPALFVYYDLLKDGYRSKNLHQIFDALQSFKNLKEHELYEQGVRYSTVLSEPWELLCINDLRRTPPDESGADPIQPIQILSLVHWDEGQFPSEIKDAITIMQELDPGLGREFHAYVISVKLFAGKILESSTSSRYFGALYLRLPYPQENPLLLFFRNVIHELSHLHLYALMIDDPIVYNPESERFNSPLRADKRPMIGIFHATFVLSRMVRGLRKFLALYPGNKEANDMLKKNEASFLDGWNVVCKHARLTQRGDSIFKSLKTCAFE